MTYVLKRAAVLARQIVLIRGKTARAFRVTARVVECVGRKESQRAAEAVVDVDDELMLIEDAARLVLKDVARAGERPHDVARRVCQRPPQRVEQRRVDVARA